MSKKRYTKMAVKEQQLKQTIGAATQLEQDKGKKTLYAGTARKSSQHDA